VTSDDFSVLIAGGGVAALEAALTLREVSEQRARVELLAPESTFWYRPVAVAEPFGLGTVRHFDLGALAEDIGVGLSLGALAAVDVPCLDRPGVQDSHLRQYARGGETDVWLVPPSS